MFGPEKIWVQKNFEAKINLGSKNFLVRKILSPKKNYYAKKLLVKNFGSKIIRVKKNFGSQKFLDPKKFALRWGKTLEFFLAHRQN